MTTYMQLLNGADVMVDVKDCVVRNTVGEHNSSSNFRATINNPYGRNTSDYAIGDVVTIKAEKDTDPPTVTVFKGIIEDIDYMGKNEFEQIIISGRDYTQRLMDATVEPVVYTNQEISAIVTNIVSTYVEDLTTTNVQVTGKTLSRISFNHINAFDAIKQLAEEAEFSFRVDSDQDLHFEVSDISSSGQSLDNTNVIKSEFSDTDAQLVNKVWVYGSRQFIKWQNTFSPDGAGSVFTLDFKPHNTQVLVAGSTIPYFGDIYEQTIDLGSATKYLVNFEDKQVVFVSGATQGDNIPASGASTLVVNYDRSTPIIKFAQDRASVDKYGAKNKIIQDENIADPKQATDLALTTIMEKSNPKKEGFVQVDGIMNLTAGNTIIVNLPYKNVTSQTYKILEVRYDFNKDTLLSDIVMSLTLNKKIDKLTDTIKELMLTVRGIQAGGMDPADVLSRLEWATGSAGARVSTWTVQTTTTGSDFYVGSLSLANGSSHPNSWVGSPGSYYAGSHAISYSFQTSGGEA